MRFWRWFYLVAVVLPLLLIGGNPELRVPLQRLISGNSQLSVLIPSDFRPSRNYSSDAYLERSPDLLDTQIWAVSQGRFPGALKRFDVPNSNGRSNYFRAAAELSRLHPDNALIAATALNMASSYDFLVAGPWEDTGWNRKTIDSQFNGSKPEWPLIGGPSSIRRTFDSSPQEIELGLELARQGLELARRGQRLEPNNTYFDWMAARYLFVLGRGEDAVQTLIAASHKTKFSRHYRELLETGFRSQSRVAPVLADDKWTWVLYDQAEYRYPVHHTANLALWNAMQAQAQGQSARALKIQGAVARLEMTAFRSVQLLGEKPYFAEWLKTTWNSPRYTTLALQLEAPWRDMSLGSLDQRELQAAQAFAQNALAHGDPALATETLKNGQSVAAYSRQNAQVMADLSLSTFFGGSLGRLTLCWWAAMIAAGQCALVLVIGLVAFVFGPLRPRKGLKSEPPSARIVFYPLGLGTVLTAAFLLASIGQFPHELAVYGNGTDDSATMCWGVAASLAPLVLCALSCTMYTVVRLIKDPPGPPLPPPALWLPPERLRQYWFISRNGAIFFSFVGLPVVGIFLFFYTIAANAYSSSPWDKSAPGEGIFFYLPTELTAWHALVGLGVIYALAWYMFWRTRTSFLQRPAIYAGLFAFRRMMAWTIPFSLWLLWWALALAVPQRADLDAQVTQIIASEPGAS